jgi:hypothetical protein
MTSSAGSISCCARSATVSRTGGLLLPLLLLLLGVSLLTALASCCKAISWDCTSEASRSRTLAQRTLPRLPCLPRLPRLPPVLHASETSDGVLLAALLPALLSAICSMMAPSLSTSTMLMRGLPAFEEGEAGAGLGVLRAAVALACTAPLPEVCCCRCWA